MSNKNFTNKLHSGFTLIETFVAITILMIAILGPMSIIAKFYADSTYAKNQIAATFLAQDGMETVINIIKGNSEERRNNPTDCSSAEWLKNVLDCKTGVGCWVNSLDNTTGAGGCSSSDPVGCPVYKYPESSSNSGFYIGASSQGNNAKTIFTRHVTIAESEQDTYVPADFKTTRRTAQITAKVSWVEKGVTKGPVTVSSMVFEKLCP